MKRVESFENAVNAINKRSGPIATDGVIATFISEIAGSLAVIADLTSEQPERQKGEWIDYTEEGYVECPFCHSATNCDGNKHELHFCFSCGADMRGEQDDS